MNFKLLDKILFVTVNNQNFYFLKYLKLLLF